MWLCVKGIYVKICDVGEIVYMLKCVMVGNGVNVNNYLNILLCC